jgi:transposase
MWKPEHRRAADRHGLRYPSDLSDSEWALIEPSIPPAKRGGRRREVNVREVVNPHSPDRTSILSARSLNLI